MPFHFRIRLPSFAFVFSMVAFALTGSAFADQGQVRIHGDGIDSQSLQRHKAQTVKSAAWGIPIGVIETVQDPAAARHADGTLETLRPGSTVYRGDQLITGRTGSSVVVFEDQSTVSLGPDSRLLLDELVYEPAVQRGTETISVLKGVFVFAGGQIAKMQPDAMTVKTPVATIGIRGTTFGVHYRPNRPLTVMLLEDSNGTVGELSVRNQAGAVTLNRRHQATRVADLGTTPSAPAILSEQEYGTMFGEAASKLPGRATPRRRRNAPEIDHGNPIRQLQQDMLRQR
ncbi:MAG: FecR family protein [Rhodospirillales bacterium]